MFQIEYTPQRKDMIKAAMHPFKRNPITYVIAIICFIQAIVAILGLSGVVKVEHITSSIVIGFVIPIFLFIVTTIAFKKAGDSHQKISLNIDTHTFLLTINNGEDDETKWRKALSIRETKDEYMIYVMAYYAIPFPKREIRNNNDFKQNVKSCTKVLHKKFTYH
ncbi:MAG: YcxB family protein [Bacteroidales bacterium]